MNIKAIIALVCGVLAVVLSFVSSAIWLFIVALVLGIAGIIFGALGMKEAKASGTGKGLAVAGLVCGIVGTALCAILLACFACASAAATAITSYAETYVG